MRYIPNTPEDRRRMLHEIGVSPFEELLTPIPENLRFKKSYDFPKGQSEWEVKSWMTKLARKNINTSQMASFMGAGSYDHDIPTAVNTLAGRSEFATAYTPYQPEVAQGTLQVIYEFQSMICELFAMDAANASMYDGGTALAEAILLAKAHTRRNKILWPFSVHPNYRQVASSLGESLKLNFQEVRMNQGNVDGTSLNELLTDEVAAVVFQYPNFWGIVEEIQPLIKLAQSKGALVIVVADPMALGIFEAPGHLGADIVVGEGQSLGNPQSFGGPYLGLFAVKSNLVRLMPGRIAGVTKDIDGRRGYVLTLQTREQHIRRDKATSNICTNQGLIASRATFYMSLVGPKGLQDIGEACIRRVNYLQRKLRNLNGVNLPFEGTHFKEFVLRLPEKNSFEFLDYMQSKNILAGVPLVKFNMRMDDCILVAVTEKRDQDELDHYVRCVEDFLNGRN